MKEFIDVSNVIMCYDDELVNSEAVEQRCSVRKVLSEISQNSQENTCARVSATLSKRDSGTGVFP